MTVDGRVTVNVFDKVGRLFQVKDGADTTTYAYYPNGNLQAETLPNGITANYTYFKNNKLKTLQNKNGETILEAYQYAYDGAGNLTAKVDVKGTTVYTYTVLSQLSTVTEPSGKVTVYTYDRTGNRSWETVTGNGVSTTTCYIANAANQLTYTIEEQEGKTVINSYHYDPAGNLISRVPESYTSTAACKGAVSGPVSVETSPADIAATLEKDKADLGMKLDKDSYAVTGISGDNSGLRMSRDVPGLYTYNARNQMVKAETWENGVDKTVENTFNYQGYRVSKTASAKTTYYSYVGDKVVKELDSTGELVYNVYGLSRISRTVNGEKVYYLYNGHGDVTALVSASKTILARYYYDAFGNVLEGDLNFPNPYLYAGYSYDPESRLYDLKARFYDAKIARFMQEDTYWNTYNSIYGDNPRYMGGNPVPDTNAMMQGLNRYSYCVNNPLIYTDPSGNSLILAAILAATTAAVVAKTVNTLGSSSSSWNSGGNSAGDSSTAGNGGNFAHGITTQNMATLLLAAPMASSSLSPVALAAVAAGFTIGILASQSKPSNAIAPGSYVPDLSGNLSQGSNNYDVRVLQRRLNKLGYTDGQGNQLAVDGIFGSKTLYAVNQYKNNAGLQNTGEYAGIVGQTTWDHLFTDKAIPSQAIDATRSAEAQVYIQYYQRQWAEANLRYQSARTDAARAIAQKQMDDAHAKANDIRSLDVNGRVTGVYYDVPLFQQGRLNLCWAYSQTMIENFYAGGGMTQQEANVQARAIAESVHGPDNWNRSGWPTDSPDVTLMARTVFRRRGDVQGLTQTADVQSVSSHLGLWGMLNDGPIYGYYVGKADPVTKRVPAHLIVITGAVSALGHETLVTSNNPWGDSNIQTYADFLSGIPYDRSGMTFNGVLRVNR